MSMGEELAPHLPFLRRYARALTGSQQSGDAYAMATLEAILADAEAAGDEGEDAQEEHEEEDAATA